MAANEPTTTVQEDHQVITTTCPWCDETATVDNANDGEFACDDCGIRAAIAPDALKQQLDRAA